MNKTRDMGLQEKDNYPFKIGKDCECFLQQNREDFGGSDQASYHLYLKSIR